MYQRLNALNPTGSSARPCILVTLSIFLFVLLLIMTGHQTKGIQKQDSQPEPIDNNNDDLNVEHIPHTSSIPKDDSSSPSTEDTTGYEEESKEDEELVQSTSEEIPQQEEEVKDITATSGELLEDNMIKITEDHPAKPTNRKPSIWEEDLTKERKATRFPNLVFVKGLKVGGTSIAYALNHAAIKYKIDTAVVSESHNHNVFDVQNCHAFHHGNLYFHHGFKNRWQEHCMPGVKFVTLLREPISQTLSWESFELNRLYFIEYPKANCPHKRRAKILPLNKIHTNLEADLNSVRTCIDTGYRKNITLMMVAEQVKKFPAAFPGEGVAMTMKWALQKLTPSKLSIEETIEYLSTQYYLVGVTERINEFLVLIAITNGWDFPSLYYRRCKKTNLDVHRKEFSEAYPELIEKLEVSTLQASAAYEWAKTQFDLHVKALGPWFPAKVKEFEEGLAIYQNHFSHGYKWGNIKYVDGASEWC